MTEAGNAGVGWYGWYAVLAAGERLFVKVGAVKLSGFVPGLELVECGDDMCCGSAGIYNLVEPDTSDAVLARVTESREETSSRSAAWESAG